MRKVVSRAAASAATSRAEVLNGSTYRCFLWHFSILNDLFAFRKLNDCDFSYAVWAQELGLSNRTVLRFILKRERRISVKSAQLFMRNLKLGIEEAVYFETLVSYSQAKTKQEKLAFGASLIKLQRSNYRPLEFQQNQELCNAISPVVLSLLAFKDVIGSAKELGRLLNIDASIVVEVPPLTKLFESSGFRQLVV